MSKFIPAINSYTCSLRVRGSEQTPEALRAYPKAELDKWTPIIKAAGINAN
jgi:tripartite-type tricarboxylate transporter receptor subunit TctC